MSAYWQRGRRVLGVVVLIGGLLFVARALYGQFDELGAAAIAIPVWTYAVATLLATATVLITATLHSALVVGMTPARIDPISVRYAYAASQVARYFPGKVFGVVLEAQMLAPAMSFGQVVIATLLQTMLTYLWAATVAAVVLWALITGSAAWAVLALPILAALWWALRHRWFERICILFAPAAMVPDNGAATDDQGRRNDLECIFWLALQWLPFFLLWMVVAMPGHGGAAALWLAASYLLASIAAAFLVLIPSGLVVRESMFIWLGEMYGLPIPSLVAFALVVRLALTLADLLALALLAAAQRFRSRA